MRGALLVGLLLLALVAVVSGWNGDDAASGDKVASAADEDARYESFITEKVRQSLRDPASARFERTHISTKSGGRVVCGYVNSKNGFGGMGGAQRFIGGGVNVLEEQMNAGEMDKLWSQVC